MRTRATYAYTGKHILEEDPMRTLSYLIPVAACYLSWCGDGSLVAAPAGAYNLFHPGTRGIANVPIGS